jgi:glutathione peroxidase
MKRYRSFVKQVWRNLPLASKVDVVGEILTPCTSVNHQAKNGVLDATVKWNFNKFLLDETGGCLSTSQAKWNPTVKKLRNI